jgi:hypothetical protein
LSFHSGKEPAIKDRGSPGDELRREAKRRRGH